MHGEPSRVKSVRERTDLSYVRNKTALIAVPAGIFAEGWAGEFDAAGEFGQA